MAGSLVFQDSLPASLSDRIEGLKLLADQLDEPVVIFNPQMELVYANPSTSQIAKECPLIPSPSILSSHSYASIQQTPCNPCPAMELFQPNAQGQNILSCPGPPAGVTPACPLPRAVPLRDEAGMTHFAILMGARGSESVVVVPQDRESTEQPHQKEGSFREAVHPPIIGES